MSSKTLSLKELGVFLSISKSSIYRLRTQDSSFPRPVKYSRDSRKLFFVQEEIEAWLANRPKA